MARRQQSKRSTRELQRLVEDVVRESTNLDGYAFLVNEVEARGKPLSCLRVWATLHYLPKGSPFSLIEPEVDLWLHEERLAELSDTIRRRLGLLHEVRLDFVHISPFVHDGVELDDMFPGKTPVDHNEINRQDGLGRTALMRAVMRRYDEQVEELLDAGADPTVVDAKGRSAFDYLNEQNLWFKYRPLLESRTSWQGI